MKLAHRILARALPPDVAEYVIGDLVERDVRGARLWRETGAVLWSMTDNASSGGDIVSAFFGDVRHGARLLRRSPAFTAVAVLTLALGIGATTAIFAVIDPVMLEPLPYPDPARVVLVWERNDDGSTSNMGFATYRDVLTQSRTLQSAAAIGSWLPIIQTTSGPERVDGDRVSWSYFRTLGVTPALGRDFAPEEDAPGAGQVVILSHALWQRSFGGDSSVIGRTVSVFGAPVTIVGVMPAGFQNVISPGAQMWRPLGYSDQPWACRSCRHLRMVARVKPGVSDAAVTAELETIHARLRASSPREYKSVGLSAPRVRDEMTKRYRPALLALGGAVVVMLLIAIANVVNLLLARSVRREEEFAVRTALGAGHGRLTRQLLAEGSLLVALGGAAGLAVAFVAIPALVSSLPAELPRLADIQLGAKEMGLALLLTVVLGLIVGLTPLIGGRVRELGMAMRSGRRASAGRQVVRSALVVGEVALALMLLMGCGLLARTMTSLMQAGPGFDARSLLTVEINSVGPRYDTAAAVFDYRDRVRASVAALPGVAGVSTASQVPLGGNVDRYSVHALDKPRSNPADAPQADRYSVGPGFLGTMGIPLLQGREFTSAEMRDSENRVAIVSRSTARAIWGDESPLGKYIRIGASDTSSPDRLVVGVAADIRHESLDASVTRQVYIPERQFFVDDRVILAVRAEGDPAALSASVRRAIRAVDPTQPIVRVATMDQLIAGSVAQRRLALILFTVFGATALAMAIAGIYGVIAGRVAEQTREIGLRSALGAGPGDIVAMVVGRGARLTATGLVIGGVGAVLFGRFLQSMLYGVGPRDPMTLAVVVAVLAVVAIVACLIPALRAMRIDPVDALRAE